MQISVIIYKILKAISNSMSYDEFDEMCISPEALKINETMRDKLLIELQESGYIKNLKIRAIPKSNTIILKPMNPQITIKGIEYLDDNLVMKKAAEIVKGIVDVVS